MINFIQKWLLSTIDLSKTNFKVNNEINFYDDEVITIELENFEKLGTIQIYFSGYLHMDIVCKENLDVVLMQDIKFISNTDLILKLELQFLPLW